SNRLCHALASRSIPPPPTSTLFPYTTLFRSVQGQRILLPRADIARETLAEELRHHGAEVDEVTTYHTLEWRNEELELPTLLRERSEEHTSELQSLRHLVCRLLLEKKKRNSII